MNHQAQGRRKRRRKRRQSGRHYLTMSTFPIMFLFSESASFLPLCLLGMFWRLHLYPTLRMHFACAFIAALGSLCQCCAQPFQNLGTGISFCLHCLTKNHSWILVVSEGMCNRRMMTLQYASVNTKLMTLRVLVVSCVWIHWPTLNAHLAIVLLLSSAETR